MWFNLVCGLRAQVQTGHHFTSLLPVRSTPFFFSRWKSLHLLDSRFTQRIQPSAILRDSFMDGLGRKSSQIAESLLLATAPGHGAFFLSECKSWRSQGKSQLPKTWKSPCCCRWEAIIQVGLSCTTRWTVVEGGLNTRPKTLSKKRLVGSLTAG